MAGSLIMVSVNTFNLLFPEYSCSMLIPIFSGYTVYFVFGAFVDSIKNKKILLCCSIIGVTSIIFLPMLTILVPSYREQIWDYNNILVCFASIGLVAMVKSVFTTAKYKGIKWFEEEGKFHKIAKYTFGIYLCHDLFLQLIEHIFILDSLIDGILYGIITISSILYTYFYNYEKSHASENATIGEFIMKVSRKKAYLIMAGMLLIISILLFQNTILSLNDGWETISAIFTIVEIAYLIIAFRGLNKSFLSLSFLFSVALILFHLGNVIVVGLDLYMPEYSQNLMIYRYGEDRAKPAIIYSIWFILFFIIGCILFSQEGKNGQKIENLKHIDWNDDKHIACKNTGLILISISILPSLYVLALMANARLTMGYAEVYNVDYRFFGVSVGWLTNLLIPGIFLLLVGISNYKKIFLRITYFVTFYYVIYMFLSGRRADGFLVIMSILILRNFFYKIKLRISSIVLCWIGLASLTFIAQTRGEEMAISEMLFSFIESIFHFDILWDFFLELGGTIRSPLLVIEVMKQYPQYRLGLTYLLSPISAVLNGLRITSSLNNFISFYSFLSSPDMRNIIGSAINNMGGSAIAEWYFNFGSIGVILVPFLAKGILYLEKKSETFVETPFLQAFCFYSFYWILRYSRGYFSEMMWVFLFTFAVAGIIYSLLERRYQ